MRFLHLADLHFGKTIHGVSLLENGDQPFWVEQFLILAKEIRPDAVLIAGDVYDRSAPSGDAVQLLDRMLTDLAALEIPVLLVAGNHDSGQRLAFASSLLKERKLHIAGLLPQGAALEHVTLRDEYGPVTFWLLPYVFPALAARALADESVRDYDTAVRRLLEAQDVDFTQRNVLIAHQNVTASGAEATRGGSESTVGGVGQVDFTAFDSFDYVALGHIHAACAVGREAVRYAGSPLCYHFDEIRQPAKGPVLVDLGEKGSAPKIQTLQLAPLHPMREWKGDYNTVRDTLLGAEGRGEYWRIVLTDRRVTPECAAFFRSLAESRGCNLMELQSEYRIFSGEGKTPAMGTAEQKTVEELFEEFYTERCGGEEPAEPDRALLHFAGERLRHREGPIPGEKDVKALLDFLTEQEGAV